MKQQKAKCSPAKKSPPRATVSEWVQFFLIAAAGAVFSTTVIWLLLSGQSAHRHGVLVAVDGAAHSLAVLNKGPGGRNTYTWNERTEFFDGDVKAGPEVLSRGAEVVVHYMGGLAVSPTAERVKLVTREPSK